MFNRKVQMASSHHRDTENTEGGFFYCPIVVSNRAKAHSPSGGVTLIPFWISIDAPSTSPIRLFLSIIRSTLILFRVAGLRILICPQRLRDKSKKLYSLCTLCLCGKKGVNLCQYSTMIQKRN